MTNKANKGFVFSAYDKFFRFLLMDNHLPDTEKDLKSFYNNNILSF